MKDNSRTLAKLLSTLLAIKGALPLPEQKVLLAALAHSGLFEEPVRTLLLVAAEVDGDEDEFLPDLLHDYLEWRRRAQRAADGQPVGPDP
jgi:hypothetical protein